MYGVLRVSVFLYCLQKESGWLAQLKMSRLRWDQTDPQGSSSTNSLADVGCVPEAVGGHSRSAEVFATSHLWKPSHSTSWRTILIPLHVFRSVQADQNSFHWGSFWRKASSPFPIKCQQIKGPFLYCSMAHQISLVRWSPPDLWRLLLQTRAFVRLEDCC